MFEQLNTATSTAIANLEALAEQLKQKLAETQEQLNQLHQQQQSELTAKATAETAIEMVNKARRMIKAAYPDSPEAMAEFNRALMEQAQLPPSRIANPAPTPGPTPAPRSTPALIPPIIPGRKIEVVEQVEQVEVVEPETEILSVEELKDLPRKQLQAIAKRKGIQANSSQANIAKRLQGITREELNFFLDEDF